MRDALCAQARRSPSPSAGAALALGISPWANTVPRPGPRPAGRHPADPDLTGDGRGQRGDRWTTTYAGDSIIRNRIDASGVRVRDLLDGQLEYHGVDPGTPQEQLDLIRALTDEFPSRAAHGTGTDGRAGPGHQRSPVTQRDGRMLSWAPPPSREGSPRSPVRTPSRARPPWRRSRPDRSRFDRC